MTTTPLDWIALADGVAHSQPRHGRGRTVCGQPRINPRFAHPIRSRCDVCLERVGVAVRRPMVPESELEKRAAWGDR